MRRRIYVHDMMDCTNIPSLWGFAEWDLDPRPLPALYDDELWERYIKAQIELDALRNVVCNAMVHEPWDDVEKRLGFKANTMIHSDCEYGDDEYSAIEDELLENAKAR